MLEENLSERSMDAASGVRMVPQRCALRGLNVPNVMSFGVMFIPVD